MKIIKNFNNSKKKLKNKFNIDNYYFNGDHFELINYLTFLEVYGELVLKSKNRLGSSVG